MVANDVVLQTVKRMVASGIDDNTIRTTLRGINLPDKEIDSILREAKLGVSGQAPEEPATEEEAVEEGEAGAEGSGEENIGEEDNGEDVGGEDIREHIESTSQEQLAHHTETHQMLDEHADKLGEVHEDVGALHEKIDSMPRISPEVIAGISALDHRLSSLEKVVAETNANTNALKSLMQKIIEANRQLLLELQKKK